MQLWVITLSLAGAIEVHVLGRHRPDGAEGVVSDELIRVLGLFFKTETYSGVAATSGILQSSFGKQEPVSRITGAGPQRP